MADSSDDESSDSSNEFLVSPDKINLNSSFFAKNPAKPNLQSSKSDNENESDDDNFRNVTVDESTNIFSEVLKNLESSNIKLETDDNVRKHESPSTSRSRQNKEHKSQGNVLSKEINDLLLQGESGAFAGSEDDEDDDDADDEVLERPSDYAIPKEGVKITLPGTSLMFNKKKQKGSTMDTFMRNLLNKLRAHQVVIHKVGLLCWLGYGFYINRLINEPIIMSTMTSLIPQESCPKNTVDLHYLEKFTNWFQKLFIIESHTSNDQITIDILLEKVKDRKVSDYKQLVLLYVAALRAIGLNCRLVMSLHPPDLKIRRDVMSKTEKEKDKKKNENEDEEKSVKSKPQKPKSNSKKSKVEEKDTASTVKAIPKNSLEAQKNAKLEARKKAAEILRSKSTNKNEAKNKSTRSKSNSTKVNLSERQDKQTEDDSKNTETTERMTISRKLRSRIISNTNISEATKESNSKEDTSGSKRTKRAKKDPPEVLTIDNVSSDSNDSAEEFRTKRPAKTKINKRATAINKNKKEEKEELSSDEEKGSPNKVKETEDIWAEVYVESEHSWICARVTNGKINCVMELYVSEP